MDKYRDGNIKFNEFQVGLFKPALEAMVFTSDEALRPDVSLGVQVVTDEFLYHASIGGFTRHPVAIIIE